MDKQVQATRVATVIGDHLCAPNPSATDSLVDDLGADSLDGVEITMAMEDAFRVSIDDDEAEACATVQDWIDLIRRKTA